MAFRERLLATFLFMTMLAQFGAGPVGAAGSPDIHHSCWASGSLSEDVAAIAREAARWSCPGGRLSIDAERVLLRFDIGPDAVLPRYFLSRRSALQAVHLLAIDRDGAVRQTSIPAASLASSMAGGYFKAPLPEVTRETRQIVAAIDLPSHKMTLENAYLAPEDAGNRITDIRFRLILAGLAGMLAMPLVFNVAFYRVLREPFVLWHLALTVSLLATVLVSSALSVAFFDPPAMTLSWMTTFTFGMTVGAAAMFTYGFIEPGLMHPFLRRLLPYCAVWAVALSTFHASFPFVARPIQSGAYTAAFAPILVVFLLSLLDALRRGSRAAKFQAIGYAPMFLVGLIRLVTGAVPWLHNIDAMLLFYFGCMFEVLFTTLGVADRFMTIRRERDQARTEADLLERLSETDPLTGLPNRRAIERQFERLRNEGFTTLAAIDIDHFKAINDVNGHMAGDAALKAAAGALQEGPNVRAYRIGGEEFVLLLRGGDADIEAERRRQAITAFVADAVPEIGQPVTASMGVTDIFGGEDFATPYKRADKLLYEAKTTGRDRTLSASRPMPEPEVSPAGRRAG